MMIIQKRCGECGNNAECDKADIESLNANECPNFVWAKRIQKHREDAAREERERGQILKCPKCETLLIEKNIKLHIDEVMKRVEKHTKQEFKRKLAEKYQWCKENRYHEVCTKDSYFYLFQSKQDFPELFKKRRSLPRRRKHEA